MYSIGGYTPTVAKVKSRSRRPISPDCTSSAVAGEMVTIMTDQLQVRSEQRQELLVRLPPTYGEAEVPREADTGAVADQDAGLQEPRAESRGVFHLDEQ